MKHDVECEPVVIRYLARLDRAMAGREAIEGVELRQLVLEHVTSALNGRTRDEWPAVAADALDELGSPERLATEGEEEPGPSSTHSPRPTLGGIAIAALLGLLATRFVSPWLGLAIGIGLVALGTVAARRRTASRRTGRVEKIAGGVVALIALLTILVGGVHSPFTSDGDRGSTGVATTTAHTATP